MGKKSLIVLFLVFVFCFTGFVRPFFAEAQRGQSSTDMNTLMGDISGAFSQMDSAFKSAQSDMTPEDDYYLGRAVAAEIIKTYKLYTANPALTAYLNRICLAIVLNSPKPTLFSGYCVAILDTDEIAAFASPGGHIFISRGLLGCAQSEDAIAAVIAHEVAHIQHRHVAAILATERTVQDLTDASNRAANIASRNLTMQERSTIFKTSLSASINALFRNGYSREQEFEADKTAVRLLIGAGYDPAALIDILGILQRRTQPGNMNSTHPSPSMRISNLGTVRGSGRDTLSARKPRFDLAIKR